ncbi:Bug family tripartite tricarboxylate transporter substrate binding protein [Tropicibacter sp. S64]|uniref:Bug family tripartite tricarboxylate transporter substrate binding protein n=1 Tax=Tropicibacter sp. S64 TaxID=3415122 RepID=UPI003C7E0872
MNLLSNRIAAVVAAAVLSATSAIPAAAQDTWPAGPLEVVMHTKPGGTSDIFIRTLAKSLEPAIGQEVIVINAPGGGGANQMSRISAAKPDGLTLGVNTLTHFTGMQTNLKGTFAPGDFSWIASVQEDPILFFVREDSPYKSFDDVIAAAKEAPESINVGGFGPVGSMQHIGMSMLENATGTRFNWIGYPSTPDIMAALLGGHVDIGVSNLGPTAEYFESGRIRGLGVLADKRLESKSDLPTFVEQGVDVDSSWIQVRGVFGPAGMPMELQQKVADAFHEAMRAESYQEYARSTGVTDSWMGPKEYSEFVAKITDVAVEQLTAAGVLQ